MVQTKDGGAGCSACGIQSGCGPSVPMDEMFKRFAEELQNSHGDKVEVKHYDTDETGYEANPIISRALKAGYPFPITAINGQLRWAGTIDASVVKQLLNKLT